MALSYEHWQETRATVKKLLSKDCPLLRDDADLRGKALVDRRKARMYLPAVIGDYTDFYSSLDHATNVGTMFRYVDVMFRYVGTEDPHHCLLL